MKEPNREPAIGYGALHTIEHLAATFLRNHPVWGDKIVFWGPMDAAQATISWYKATWRAATL